MEVLRLTAVTPDQVQTYWQTLYMHDTLKYRFCNIKEPNWSYVLSAIVAQGNHMFFVEDAGKLVAEFALENFSGLAAQIHFSMHPDNDYRYSQKVAEFALAKVLTKFKTLWGSTPLLNRVACMFVLNVGFKKLCIMPNSVNYMGKISDAMISMRASNG